ncbi:MAG: hypothetical protein M3T49_08210 [Candidatus Eremiobacteraeota bacterium]|nr:hypothetical protein [Candidatus Eremiobacteraeota bacterium]
MNSMTDVTAPPSEDFADANRIDDSSNGSEGKRTLMAGVIGAAVASVGYMIYSRLEDSQKQAIRESVSKFVEDKVADVRSQLKL